MSTRWVVHLDQLARIDAGPLLSDLADDVASDAQRLAPVETGDLASTIRVLDRGRKSVKIAVGGIKGKITGETVDYHMYVEEGTSKMKAQPYMRPALYRYRAAR
jgi:HK97 gp10 family phage protein